MKTSHETTALMTALLQARCNMETVRKHSKNPFFKSSYADWPTVLAVAMPALDANALVLTIAPGEINLGWLNIEGRITHAPSGQFLSTNMHLPAGEKVTAQSVGSAITYASRYLTQSLLALPSVDDDGNQSSGKVFKVAEHPDYPKWKKSLLSCKTEEDLDAWVQKNYDAVKPSPHNDELNLIYQDVLDKVR